MTVSRRLLLAFAAVICVFLAVGATSLFSSLRLGEADRWNRHTFAVMEQGNLLLQAMTDMETGARGYLVESAAAADSLRQQAQALVQAVAVFRLAGGQAAAAPVRAPAVRAAATAMPARAPAAKTLATATVERAKASARAPAAVPAQAHDEDWATF